MPSPIGHALAGLAAGWMVSDGSGLNSPRREALLFAALGALPDVDLLVGAHRGPTHGVGAALVIGLFAFAVWPAGAASRLRGAAACGMAYGSHILLDWLGSDTSAPIGIMALWPISRDYFESNLHVFMAVSRRYWQGEIFWRQNLVAFARELVILLPIVVAIGLVRRRVSIPRVLRAL